MSHAKRKQEAQRLGELLARGRELRERQQAQVELRPVYRLLARWQSDRLARTYADFMRQKRYRKAVEFFLTDLYGPHDFTQRDHDMERVYPLMVRVLTEHAIESITLAIELHTLSQEFDLEMVQILGEELGVRTRLDPDTYAEAFRRCGDYPTRRHQIALVEQVGRVLDEVVRNPLIYGTVRVARGPAHMMGFAELQDFIERGFNAFRKMGGAEEFLDAIVTRETRILEQIIAGEPASVWDHPP